MESANFLERVAGGDRVYEEKTFTGAHVLLAHSSAGSEWQGPPESKYHTPIFFLASRIKDVKQCDLIVDDALFSVRVYDRYSMKDSNGGEVIVPSIVGSYSSTNWPWMNWMVRADLPTPKCYETQFRRISTRHSPPPPTTTSLYSLKNCACEYKNVVSSCS